MRYLPGREVAASSSKFYRTSTVAQQPFSEQEILNLHDIFMTNGVHHMSVNNVADGRAIVGSLLESLHYYHDVAALTVEGAPLEPTVYDLYFDMVHQEVGFVEIKEFLVDGFYSDFLWIEETQILREQLWYADFEQAIIDTHLNERMPIIILNY